MQLKTENSRPVAVMNFDQVRDVLSKLNEDGNSFAILEIDKRFIQTAINGATMVVEKNDGSKEQHYRATPDGSEHFRPDQVEAIFRSWYEQTPMPAGVLWSRIDVHGVPRPLVWLLWALPWVAGAYIVYGIIRSSHDVWKLFR